MSSLEQLERLYPHYDRDTLKEILRSCNDSVEAVKLLISENSVGSDVRKRKLGDDSSLHKYQKSIMNYFSSGEPKDRDSDFGVATKMYSTVSRVPVPKTESRNNVKSIFFDEKESSKTSTNGSRPKKKSKIIYLNHDDISDSIPFLTFHKNFLPKEMADSLLNYFIDDEKGYIKREFYVHGKVAHTDHLQCAYAKPSVGNDTRKSHYYNGKEEGTKAYTDLIKEAERLIAVKVNEELKKRRRLKFQSKKEWEGNMCIINKYETKAQTIDWHSDRLTYIGPHCIIASYSLGATRPFCMRDYIKNPDSSEQITYSVALTHNSLAIMHAGFQEKYQHSVKSSSKNNTFYSLHPILNETRINLTFRNHLMSDEDIEICPKCGSKMMLRMATKGQRVGHYMWLCTSSQHGAECNGFKWADFNEC